MALVVIAGARPELLRLMLSKVLMLRLFRNNRTPLESDIVSDYMEAAFEGYTAIRLESALWNIAGNLGKYDPDVFQIFRCSDVSVLEQIYGYYVTQGRTSLRWAERFGDGPYPIQFSGDEVGVRPVFGFE